MVFTSSSSTSTSTTAKVSTVTGVVVTNNSTDQVIQTLTATTSIVYFAVHTRETSGNVATTIKLKITFSDASTFTSGGAAVLGNTDEVYEDFNVEVLQKTGVTTITNQSNLRPADGLKITKLEVIGNNAAAGNTTWTAASLWASY